MKSKLSRFLRYLQIERGFSRGTIEAYQLLVMTTTYYHFFRRDMVDYIIKVENLIKRFGKLGAVNDISFSVAPGEIFGFLGPT